MEEMEKMAENKKIAENNLATLEQKFNKLHEENIQIRNMLELSERDKKLVEKNLTKVNGNYQTSDIPLTFVSKWGDHQLVSRTTFRFRP